MEQKIRDIKIEYYCSILDEVALFLSKNKAWYPIQRDFELNSQKLKAYCTQPYNWKYMGKGFIEDSKTESFYTNDEGFIMATVWSLRGLRFIQLISEELNGREDKKLDDIPSKCYEKTLKNHHGVITRTISSSILKLVSINDLPAWKVFKFDTRLDSSIYIQALYKKLSEVINSITIFLKYHNIDENLLK